MSNTRRLIVSVLGNVLLAAPFIGSQDVKTSKAKGMIIQPLPIQALGFLPRRGLVGLLQVVPVSAPAMGAPDLSRYRGFQFGERLPAVAKQAGLDVSEAKLIHARPALIQELNGRSGSRAAFHRIRTRSGLSCSAFTTGSFFESWSVTIGLKPKG